MTQDEIIRMAQKAGLVPDEDYGYLEWWYFAKLIAAHEREALGEPVKQEPVAWIEVERGIPMFVKFSEGYNPEGDGFISIYAAPVSAKREWVELTDDDYERLLKTCRIFKHQACAAIAAFKEKNK